MMEKRGGVVFWLIIAVVVALGVFIFAVFFVLNNASEEKVVLRNPSEGLSFEESVSQFDESFVIYLLYSIGARKLHNLPLSSDSPKIEFYIGERVYNAEVIKGTVKVNEGEIDSEDIIIRTSVEEAVKMVMDKNYISESFSSGRSSIELVSGKTTLFAKGYLEIYKELTGKTIEG